MKIPFCLRDNWIAVLFSNFSFGHDPTGENVVKVGAGFGWHGDAHAAAFSEPSGGGIVCCALAGGTSVIVGANDNICHLRRQDQIFDPTSRERGPNRHCARYGNAQRRLNPFCHCKAFARVWCVKANRTTAH
jgi:hypothetical protein